MAPRHAHWYALFVAKQAFKFLTSPTTAVPHRLVKDDVYEGYFLPAGSMVIGNAW